MVVATRHTCWITDHGLMHDLHFLFGLHLLLLSVRKDVQSHCTHTVLNIWKKMVWKKIVIRMVQVNIIFILPPLFRSTRLILTIQFWVLTTLFWTKIRKIFNHIWIQYYLDVSIKKILLNFMFESTFLCLVVWFCHSKQNSVREIYDRNLFLDCQRRPYIFAWRVHY